MGLFITSRARIEQTEIPGYWKTIDNELYLDDNGDLLLVPRFFYSDGYTFPGLVMLILGDKHKYDVRACHGHDLLCRFHERLKVNLSIIQLKLMGLLREHEGMFICEDIPMEHISIEKVSKTYADDVFKRMMLACDMDTCLVNKIRFGVFFNINWWLKCGKKSLTQYDIFNENIGLVNGV